MIWTKHGDYRWKSDQGHTILKYRFTDKYSFLLYAPGESLDGGDYSTHGGVKAAKDAAL